MQRAIFLPTALVLVFATAAPALELIELKSGKIYEASEVSVKGDKVLIRVTKGGGSVRFGVPIDKVVPEFVYYAWARGIRKGDADGHVRLAVWARKLGMFSQAMTQYNLAAETRPKIKKSLEELEKKLGEEEATWLFEKAWEHVRENDPARARMLAERLMQNFPQSAEVARTKELVKIIEERESFIEEQKAQEQIVKRARRHRLILKKLDARIDQADRVLTRARFSRIDDAEGRLNYAAYTFRKAGYDLGDLLMVVELDDLKETIESFLKDLEPRLVRTWLRLGDLRFMMGDMPGSLEAVHEVLGIEPKNEAALQLRKKLLEDSSRANSTGYYPGHGGYYGYGYVYRRCRHRQHAYPYPVRSRGYAYPQPVRHYYRNPYYLSHGCRVIRGTHLRFRGTHLGVYRVGHFGGFYK
ncbi:MAG: hypothetical protein V3T86_04190 [Planctomycetota bacterium]